MVEYIEEDLTGSRFQRVRLGGSQFQEVDLSGATMRSVRLSGVRVRDVAMEDVSLLGVYAKNVEIYGEIQNLTVNGVEVWSLVEAELDRRYPERVKMRPTDPAGFREGWDTVQRLWAGTVERARSLDPALLHESVGGEWSFIQTLRHLSFATECWLLRAILGDPAPWHPLSLPWDEMPETPGVPQDRSARPSLDEALALRADRAGRMRDYLDKLTDDSLAADTTPVEGPGWPEPRSYPVRECLLTVLNEEWEHRLYAERDLSVLQGQA